MIVRELINLVYDHWDLIFPIEINFTKKRIGLRKTYEISIINTT